MTKKDFFSKLKNYNNELEQVLEKKTFSSDIKNLLLSMFYKVEVSYKDYQKVKRVDKDKNDLMEELIKVIEKNCNKIEIVEPNSSKGKVLQKYNLYSISDRTYKKIISYPIEADLLYAIADIERSYYYINEDHYIENKIFEKMLSIGYCMNLKEIIRDFSGWSWKIETKEIENISYNLIYQIIRILVGYKFLEDWKNDGTEKTDYVIKLQEKLSHNYGAQNAVLLYKSLYVALAVIACEKNEKLKQELAEENKKALYEIEVVQDKVKYLDEITNSKKQMAKQIKQIDETINNEKLLEKELEKRRKKMGKKSQLLNKQYLKALLSDERRKIIEKMQKLTYLMNPKNYESNKEKIEEKYEKTNEILQILETQTAYESLLELQKQFLNCMEVKVKNTNNKKELINLIYYIRYYVQLPINEEKTIKDLDKLRMQINKIEEMIIAKCINLKIINVITHNGEINYRIIKKILLSQAVNLENLEIEAKPKYNKLKINVYDGEELEDSFEIEVEGTAEKVNIKTEKKLKLFN